MNYDKLSRSLRYYYEKGIMQKVAGESASRRAHSILFTFSWEAMKSDCLRKDYFLKIKKGER